ncbi:uncharacterized protein VP01_3859g2 [Puccinia sorghi]|uniref:Uncharacterized protein n=1 Tax=Puccinia sorghi TaxID=27349 RepID=A0A0L6UT65_9BASI|nr:uncharacterized protein VP01_3859g2 [Puccinia sorghi]
MFLIQCRCSSKVHILTRQEEVRQAALLMWKDHITLVVALYKAGKSNGTLYLDNGKSCDHKSGHFLYKKFLIKKQGPNSFTHSSSDGFAQTLKSTHQALRSSLTQYQ